MTSTANRVAASFVAALAVFDGTPDQLKKRIEPWAKMLENVGSPRPEAGKNLIYSTSRPRPEHFDNGVHWPVRFEKNTEAVTEFWVRVIGLDRAWFVYSDGFLVWTEHGLNVRASEPDSDVAEEANGQFALAF